jgi:hypothetical protein
LTITVVVAPTATETPGKGTNMITWFASLGAAAKLLLASTVVAVATVGAGAAVALPLVEQETVNSVATEATETPTAEPTVEPTAEPTDDPAEDGDEGTHPDNFGGMVSELAQDKPGSGYEFGKLISAAAHDKKNSDDAEETPTDDVEVESDDADTADDSGDHTEGNAGSHGGGKPEGTPGGGKPDKAKKH